MTVVRSFLAAIALQVVNGLQLALGADNGAIEYNRHVRPILAENCFACHGPDSASRQAELRLDQREAAVEAAAIVPNKPKESEVIRRVFSEDPDEIMPPPSSHKKLTVEQKELLQRWVASGANYEPHWSFIAPVRQEAPRVQGSGFRVQNPIDAIITVRLQSEGLTMSAAADRSTLIRRVSLDLTGLPPTIDEVDEFLRDGSSNAYEKLVDRLLSSPRYGEHMARYWLDAARYGDTHGMHQDNERSLWPYRDWVIKAFNENKPFDQFTIEQLAGDLLPGATREQQVATGFNRCNVTTSEGGSIDAELRVRYTVDRVETTTTVWLGLTAGCAACHDHKFDPITQREFYQLYAFFNSIDDDPKDLNALAPPPVLRLETAQQEAELRELLAKIETLQAEIKTTLAKTKYDEPMANGSLSAQLDPQHSLAAWEETIRKAQQPAIPAEVVAAVRVEPAKRKPEQQQQIRDYFLEHVYADTRSVFEPLNKQLAEAQQQKAALEKSIPVTMVAREMERRLDAFVLIRGQYDTPGEKVEPNVPAALPPLPADAPRNRLGFAKWLVDPSHPLTARVTVNRLWQQCFGRGLVETAEDFGVQGQWPSHPELLDWLATEFVRSGWNVKHILRSIVTSAAYRQSSNVTTELLQKDPENRLISRGPRFRMDAEMIRDQALFASGLLVEQIGGRSVKPYQPSGLWEAISDLESNTREFRRDTGPGLYRRSVYTFWKRTSPPPSLATMDAPSRDTCVVRRSRTNTPLQALALMNDEQFVEAARVFAERVLTSGGNTNRERATFAFRTATARQPDATEVSTLLRQLEMHLATYKSDSTAAAALLRVGERPRNDTLDTSELAAWTIVCNLLLNLDEAVTKR
jgi:hypothetical protein